MHSSFACRETIASSELTGLNELEATELEALLLEALDDVADQPALHGVGLDHDEGALAGRHGHSHATLLLAS